ncbi:hypothetical protein IX306_001467 [Porphyromonas levii]|nr:hypothetical protein [Porphyromonas levii]
MSTFATVKEKNTSRCLKMGSTIKYDVLYIILNSDKVSIMS